MFELDSMVILFSGILDARVQVEQFDYEFSLDTNPQKRRKLQMLREMRER